MMNWFQFVYFLEHLSVKMFILFTIANVLVCGNILVLKFTFKFLRRGLKRKECLNYHEAGKNKKPTTTKPDFPSIRFVDAETGKREGWRKKVIWVKEQ